VNPLLRQSAASRDFPPGLVAFDAWTMRIVHLGHIVGIRSGSAKRKARKKFTPVLEHI
jgi:hypothetical protein